MNKFFRYILIFVSGALIFFSCSRKKDRFINRNWHALNTKYNVLFNGGVAYEAGLNDIESKYDENFWEILPIEQINIKDFSIEDDEKNSDLQRAEEKAIKAVQTHGMSIKGKEKNPQIDEAYILLGKARYYSGRFIPAIEAFNYVLFKYPGSSNINTAKVWKAKTNLRLENEAIVLENLNLLLQKKDLNNDDRLEALTTLAQLYINQSEIDLAITSIEKAVDITKNKEQKGRLLYIQGQLYNLKNIPEMANSSFQKVIDLKRSISRKYRINAFLEQIKNFNYDSGDLVVLHEFLEFLENDRENRPFLAMIYHVIANHYIKISNDSIAIDYYNKSLSSNSKDQYLSAVNYHTLADYYYDNSNYILAGAYYDSTLTRYNKKNKSYRLVKKRFENLKDVIFYETIARENDSILRLTKMSENQLEDFFQPYVENLIVEQKKYNSSNKKSNFKKINLVNDNKGVNKGGFYFYQTTTVAYGKNAFINFWGERPLADNWRWSSKSENKASAIKLQKNDSVLENKGLTTQYFIKKLPKAKEEIDSIKNKRDLAYYRLGLIYRNKFKDYPRSIESLQLLLNQQPKERLILPAKYNLYKAYTSFNKSALSDKIRIDIIENYPDSRYAKILLNPQEILQADSQSPMERYRSSYEDFQAAKYQKVINDCELEILAFEGEDIVPKFELLKTISSARLYGLEAYKEGLNYLSLNYPNSTEGKRAQNIIENVIPGLENESFTSSSQDTSFKAIFSFSALDKDRINQFKLALEDIIDKEIVFELTASEDIYDINTTFVVVHGLKSISGALGFVELLEIDDQEILSRSYFAISSTNYKTLQIHKNLDSYLKNFNNKN